jgi:hypothetical protein
MSYGMLGFESLINECFVICDYVYEVQSCLLSQMQRLKLCLIVYSLSARSSILQANNTWPFFERFFSGPRGTWQKKLQNSDSIQVKGWFSKI